jgi:hypothetical protein
VALNIFPTTRESVADVGTPDEVANTLVSKALTAPGTAAKVISTKQRKDKAGSGSITLAASSTTLTLALEPALQPALLGVYSHETPDFACITLRITRRGEVYRHVFQ